MVRINVFNSSLPLMAVMQLCKVKQYIADHKTELNLLAFDNLDQYVFIEQVKPYDAVAEHQVYIDADQLRSLLPAQYFKEMQCVLITCIDERRYFQSVVYN